MKKFAIPTLCSIFLFVSCSESQTSNEDLGQHLFETIQSLDTGEKQLDSRRGSIEELRTFSKIDTLPVQTKTLDKIFNLSKEDYSKIISYQKLMSLKEEYGIHNWKNIEFVDSKQKYLIDPPRNGDKYGDDIPLTIVTVIFKYDSKKYSIEGAYFKNENGNHLLTVKNRLKDLN